MALVSNSSPLISLARIQKLDLLPRAFPEILVPTAVYGEVTADLDLPGAREVAKASWLSPVEVKDTKAVDRLRYWLDLGESEAIVLAQTRDSSLAIDERRGRNIAASLGLKTTGTVGILLALKKLGLVKDIAPLLDDLVGQGIRLSRRLYDSTLAMARER